MEKEFEDGKMVVYSKEDNIEKIRDSIETTIKSRDEDALIGLGVLFELLWTKLNNEEKEKNT